MGQAVVTGASSGIGLEVTKMLCKLNYSVVGIARNFEKCNYKHNLFETIRVDVTQKDELKEFAKSLLAKTDVDLLINSAGIGEFEPHEELSVEAIEKMVQTNLTAPMVLTNLLLRSLKKQKGTVINFTSIEALKNSKFSAVYSATKAGLRHFGLSLFEEVRKSGVKVVTINPDMTQTEFFDSLRFNVGESTDTYLEPTLIAQTVKDIIKMPRNSVITELTLRPQKFGITKKRE